MIEARIIPAVAMSPLVVFIVIVVILFLIWIIRASGNKVTERERDTFDYGRLDDASKEILPPEIHGTAKVIDADGIIVNDKKVRLAGIDAPEWDQSAVTHNDRIVPQGAHARGTLANKIDGKQVRVAVHGQDKFNRIIGTVYLADKDINEWMILRGLATISHGYQYQSAERWARQKKLGMWGYKKAYSPYEWRRLKNIIDSHE